MEGNSIVLPPQFMGSTAYYALIASASAVSIDETLPFDKRFKSIHRTRIDGANGTSFITVPVSKPESMSTAMWSDIRVSAHGGWWNEMLTALHSAYGRTPFFEFYIDEFAPLLSAETPGIPILELDRRLDRLLRRLLQIDTDVTYITTSPEKPFKHPSAAVLKSAEESVEFIPYYQIRAIKHGFQPNLSAADLLFNMGPESPLILRRMAAAFSHDILAQKQ